MGESDHYVGRSWKLPRLRLIEEVTSRPQRKLAGCPNAATVESSSSAPRPCSWQDLGRQNFTSL
eukprot:8608464-Pyramimonas_sp.AAC.1